MTESSESMIRLYGKKVLTGSDVPQMMYFETMIDTLDGSQQNRYLMFRIETMEPTKKTTDLIDLAKECRKGTGWNKFLDIMRNNPDNFTIISLYEILSRFGSADLIVDNFDEFRTTFQKDDNDWLLFLGRVPELYEFYKKKGLMLNSVTYMDAYFIMGRMIHAGRYEILRDMLGSGYEYFTLDNFGYGSTLAEYFISSDHANMLQICFEFDPSDVLLKDLVDIMISYHKPVATDIIIDMFARSGRDISKYIDDPETEMTYGTDIYGLYHLCQRLPGLVSISTYDSELRKEILGLLCLIKNPESMLYPETIHYYIRYITDIPDKLVWIPDNIRRCAAWNKGFHQRLQRHSGDIRIIFGQ